MERIDLTDIVKKFKDQNDYEEAKAERWENLYNVSLFWTMLYDSLTDDESLLRTLKEVEPGEDHEPIERRIEAVNTLLQSVYLHYVVLEKKIQLLDGSED